MSPTPRHRASSPPQLGGPLLESATIDLTTVASSLGSTSTATRVARGTSSSSSPSRFDPMPADMEVTPVMLPSGRSRLETRPASRVSAETETIGIVVVPSSLQDRRHTAGRNQDRGTAVDQVAGPVRKLGYFCGEPSSSRPQRALGNSTCRNEALDRTIIEIAAPAVSATALALRSGSGRLSTAPSPAMNSRRRIRYPSAGSRAYLGRGHMSGLLFLQRERRLMAH